MLFCKLLQSTSPAGELTSSYTSPVGPPIRTSATFASSESGQSSDPLDELDEVGETFLPLDDELDELDELDEPDELDELDEIDALRLRLPFCVSELHPAASVSTFLMSHSSKK